MSARPAEAYIDPGTGANLLSSLGIVLGIACTGVAICFTQIKRCCLWLVAVVVARRAANHTDDEETEP